MRKKSLRFISAALAVSMMASTLPVGAFALEVGAGETTAAVSEQEAVKAHHLNGGKTIDEDFVETYGTVYTLSGNYTQGISITTSKDITINVDNADGDVTVKLASESEAFLNVSGTGKVTINGTKDGVEQSVSVTASGRNQSFLKVDEAESSVVVNGGEYSIHNFEDDALFRVSHGVLELNEVKGKVTGESNYNGYVIYGENVMDGDASVTMQGGEFVAEGTGQVLRSEHGTTVNAYGGVFTAGENSYRTIGVGGEANFYKSDFIGGKSTCVQADGIKLAMDACTFKNESSHVFWLQDSSFNNDETVINIKNSTIVAEGNAKICFDVPYWSFANYGGPMHLTLENMTIKGFKQAVNYQYNPDNDPDMPELTLKNVTFEDNEADLYVWNEDGTPTNAPQVELDEGTKDTAGAITVQVANPAEGVQITTKTTDKDYQQNLKLTSKNDGWLIGYKKDADGDADGEYRYLTRRESDKHFGLNTINATATTGEGDNAITLEPYAQVKEDTEVTLTANAAPEGKKFARWKVEKVADGTPVTGLLDAETENTENTSFSMPEYDVIITAEYEDEIIVDPGTGDSDYGGDIAAGVVIGGIAAVGAYEVGTGLYRILAMDDVTMPTNRIALAKLLWERAGKPEPESTALYSDISAEDTDAQKAARWAVEQELLKDDTSEDEQKFHPAFPVSKLRVCLTWEKAKQKGLFDKTEA